MIPKDRPVLGRDLETIRQQRGLLAADAGWMFGISPNKWMDLARKEPNAPVKDPTIALLVRVLDEHPEINLMPTWPTPEALFSFVRQVRPTTTQAEFSVMHGFDQTAAGRWFSSGSRQTAPAARLMFILHFLLAQAREPEQRSETLERWHEMVTQEARARGIPDIFARRAKWSPPDAANDDQA